SVDRVALAADVDPAAEGEDAVLADGDRSVDLPHGRVDRLEPGTGGDRHPTLVDDRPARRSQAEAADGDICVSPRRDRASVADEARGPGGAGGPGRTGTEQRARDREQDDRNCPSCNHLLPPFALAAHDRANSAPGGRGFSTMTVRRCATAPARVV